ncbi:MAG: hypothetical protein JXB45_02595 [Candidatus Krumholzibacteriota bacterium]|nr:hypothetical protein [Candidatus Krumholzibacteriota bacterium]
MKKISGVFFLFLLVLAVRVPALAHGARCSVRERTVGIEAVYDDGSPMSFCEVIVYSPDAEETEFMTAQTDRQGRFAFCPDRDGLWRITVGDGMGHQVSVEIEVEAGTARGAGGSRDGDDRIRGSIVGISVIFGLFGLCSLFFRKRGISGERAAGAEGGTRCI